MLIPFFQFLRGHGVIFQVAPLATRKLGMFHVWQGRNTLRCSTPQKQVFMRQCSISFFQEFCAFLAGMTWSKSRCSHPVYNRPSLFSGRLEGKGTFLIFLVALMQHRVGFFFPRGCRAFCWSANPSDSGLLSDLPKIGYNKPLSDKLIFSAVMLVLWLWRFS